MAMTRSTKSVAEVDEAEAERTGDSPTETSPTSGDPPSSAAAETTARPNTDRGKTVHGEPANAGHRVLAPDDAEVEAYLETALHAPAPDRTPTTTGPTAPRRTRSSCWTSAASSPS